MAKTRSKGAASPVSDKVQRPRVAKTKRTKKSPKQAVSEVASLETSEPEKEPASTEQSKPAEEPHKESSKGLPVSPSSIIPEKVPKKAISELSKYLTRVADEAAGNPTDQKSQLFQDEAGEDDANTLYLTIESKKFFSTKPQFKPKSIKLTKSIYNDNTKICLILRDEIVKTEAEIEQLEQEGSLPSNLSQIVPVRALKTEFKSFEKKRDLLSQYDVFLVDDAVLNTMPTLLGKTFYQSSKIPLPIRVSTSSNNKQLSVQTLKNQLQKAMSSTWYLPPQGTVVSIKIGNLGASDAEAQDALVSNIQDVVSAFDINNIKTIMVKTAASPALPLYYTDSLYDEDADVMEEDADDVAEGEAEAEAPSKGELSAFEKTLSELADAETVAKVLGKKLKETTKSKTKQNRKVKNSKVTKPNK